MSMYSFTASGGISSGALVFRARWALCDGSRAGRALGMAFPGMHAEAGREAEGG